MFSVRGRNSFSLAFIYSAGRFGSPLEHGIAFFPLQSPRKGVLELEENFS